MQKKDTEIIAAEKIDKMNKKLEKFIAKQLEAYETKGKAEHNFKHLAPEMAIPLESLQ
ncbi:MAG: hypothetical protein MZV49_11310 [Rhodopseudomonas palustris]|nr:hypothetical protein [Rhodopseudomonas palustris]